MPLVVLEPAATQELTTLAAARAECGVSADPATDDALISLIRQASGACARFCNRAGFARERVLQTWVGPGPLVLERDIEPEVVSISTGGGALDEDEWLLDGPLLIGVSGRWNCAFGAQVSVDYRGGYELLGTLPDDIERACLVAVRGWWHARGRDPAVRGYTVEGVGATSFAAPPASVPGAAGLPAEAAALLGPWRRLGF